MSLKYYIKGRVNTSHYLTVSVISMVGQKKFDNSSQADIRLNPSVQKVKQR